MKTVYLICINILQYYNDLFQNQSIDESINQINSSINQINQIKPYRPQTFGWWCTFQQILRLIGFEYC